MAEAGGLAVRPTTNLALLGAGTAFAGGAAWMKRRREKEQQAIRPHLEELVAPYSEDDLWDFSRGQPSELSNALEQEAYRRAGLRKFAGILEPLIYAPFSALASAILAPGGDRGKAGAIGALLGAGMASLAQKEYETRRAAGEPVSAVDFMPLFKSLLAGLAVGGGARVLREREEGNVSTMSAILAGAPAGALMMGGHPILGSAMGGASGAVLARLGGRKPETPAAKPPSPIELQQARVEAAIRRAHERIRALQEWTKSTGRSSPSRP